MTTVEGQSQRCGHLVQAFCETSTTGKDVHGGQGNAVIHCTAGPACVEQISLCRRCIWKTQPGKSCIDLQFTQVSLLIV